MFNWIKPKNSPAASSRQTARPADLSAADPQSKKDALISEAMSHAKVAREAIGEETLQKIRHMMEKQQQAKTQLPPVAAAKEKQGEISPMEQAKKILQSMEPHKLADHLRLLREHDKNHH